jgi:hypothetical protein
LEEEGVGVVLRLFCMASAEDTCRPLLIAAGLTDVVLRLLASAVRQEPPVVAGAKNKGADKPAEANIQQTLFG